MNRALTYSWIAAVLACSSSEAPISDAGNDVMDAAMIDVVAEASAPSVPTLAGVGALNHIILSWQASSGDGLVGYNVYRSTDGASFAKITSAPVNALTYDDPIASPSGDGIFFYYRITSVSTLESAPSNVVKQIHGERVMSSASGYASNTAPVWVVETSVVISGGDLNVENATKVYVLDGVTIDLEASRTFLVNGMLQVLATSSAPAHFTTHKLGGSLADGEGFSLRYENCDPANVLQNTTVDGLEGGQNTFQISINSAPKITNCKISANASTGTGYLSIVATAAPAIDHTSFDKIIIDLGGDLRASAFAFDHNVVTNSYYSFETTNVSIAPIVSGQVAMNAFDGGMAAYIFGVPDGIVIPIGGNFWSGGMGSPPLPTLTNTTSTATYDFTTALTAAPVGVGPNW